MENIGKNQQDAWSLMGDLNNILNIEDRTCGKELQEAQFVDLRAMRDNPGMFYV